MRRTLPGSNELPMRVNGEGKLMGRVDEEELKRLSAEKMASDPPPLAPVYRGESYGTNQLDMTKPEKEVCGW